MRVCVGADHAGFLLKEQLAAALKEEGHEVLDVGTHSTDPVDYPDSAAAVGAAATDGRAERAILICGSGVGAEVAANKVPGVRAAVCHDTYSAHQGVEHDDMNVLVLGARVVGPELAVELMHAFLAARFSNEPRHAQRLAKVLALERTHMRLPEAAAGTSGVLDGDTHNPIRELRRYGQSVWLDFIRRSLISSGELERAVHEDGLAGVTSNPTLFEQAIDGSNDYAAVIEDLASDPALGPKRVFEILAIQDIQRAADVFRPVYEQTAGRDGYVCLEVSPDLARDTGGTIAEARRFWEEIDRSNVMIKVPATPEGIPAIRSLLADGINVNITLMFAHPVYEEVAEAFLQGLESRAASGHPIDKLASVASLFVGRLDTSVDSLLAPKIAAARGAERAHLEALVGKAAIANARACYQTYQRVFSSERWAALRARGAQTQRLLWASTGVKNPSYRDVLYLEELIGPDTVTTVPPETLAAFRSHGRLRASLEDDAAHATEVLDDLEAVGIPLTPVTDKLLIDGIDKFARAWSKLLEAVERRLRQANRARVNAQSYSLPPELAAELARRLAAWDLQHGTRRLWEGDASLWTGHDEAHWLGWLGIVETELENLESLQRFADDVRREGFTHVLLLGMGGSSLCPEVLRKTFGRLPGSPELLVLDSTDPAQVRAFTDAIDLKRSLFIVSSKSGTTLEPNIFKAYFFQRVREVVGDDAAGSRFVAITDPGSDLERAAVADRFRWIAHGTKSIGGRYSALSDFGMVPAALMGLDVERLLQNAGRMFCACAPAVPATDNPGLALGTLLGLAAQAGKDKLTLVVSPGVFDLGAWLEQLLAESTGKQGKGIIPIDRERVGPPQVYGQDRVFVYLRLEEAPEPAQDAAVLALEEAGAPVVRIGLTSKADLAQELVRWEIATAMAGAVLRINPFDQPDVEASKIATRTLTSEYERTGGLPPETPFFEADGIKLFADPANAAAIGSGAGASLGGCLKSHLDRLGGGDYFALLAYLPMTPAHEESLQRTRHRVRDGKRVATCLGFGPRFLHSTGQLYKGGPDSGVFLQITCEDAEDIPVPGQKYTFGVVKAAQARGDFQVLAERKRRALRVHLGRDVAAGLATLDAAIQEALRT